MTTTGGGCDFLAKELSAIAYRFLCFDDRRLSDLKPRTCIEIRMRIFNLGIRQTSEKRKAYQTQFLHKHFGRCLMKLQHSQGVFEDHLIHYNNYPKAQTRNTYIFSFGNDLHNNIEFMRCTYNIRTFPTIYDTNQYFPNILYQHFQGCNLNPSFRTFPHFNTIHYESNVWQMVIYCGGGPKTKRFF